MTVADDIPWGSTIEGFHSWLGDSSERHAALAKETSSRAKQAGARIGAFITVDENLQPAMLPRTGSNSRESALRGIPIAVKDVIATAGIATTAQSRAPKPAFCDGSVDAWCVGRLRQAGAIIIGKTTTLEFAKGLPDRDGPFPLPRNPWNLDHWPGGSSAGSAAAVAAGIVPLALGTDTAGSVRLPASYCGVTGFKPTRGLISLDGCLRLAPSLDHLGLLGRSSEDCQIALLAILPCVKDGLDDIWNSEKNAIGDEIRLGVDMSLLDKTHATNDVKLAFYAAIEVLENSGFTVQAVSLPDDAGLSSAIRIVNQFENYSVFREILYLYGDMLGESARRRLCAGRSLTRSSYQSAIGVLRNSKKEYLELFTNIDFLITPTASSVAETIESVYRDSMDRLALTRLWNGLGFPAVSVPMGYGYAGLPVGLQMIGRPFTDLSLLKAASLYQSRTTWHLEIARSFCAH